MKLLKLTSSTTKTVSAIVTNMNKDKRLYYAIKHGSSGLWVYILGLDSMHFKPKEENQILELTNDNYILVPIRHKKELLKDRKDNTRYSLTIDDMYNHKKDIILFWEIPNRYYTDVMYTTIGLVEVLAEGQTGRERSSTQYVSPAPILEIVGDCTLEWNGTDKDGKKVGQIIKYNYADESFNITQI